MDSLKKETKTIDPLHYHMILQKGVGSIHFEPYTAWYILIASLCGPLRTLLYAPLHTLLHKMRSLCQKPGQVGLRPTIMPFSKLLHWSQTTYNYF